MRMIAINKKCSICSRQKSSGGVLFLSNNNNTLDLFNWISAKEKCVLFRKPLNMDIIKLYRPDFIVSYNYCYIVPADVIDYMKERIINLHISYLPWNRGANPNFWSFIDNTPKGVTIHKIAKGLDTGDIIILRCFAFDEARESFATTYNSLHQNISELLKKYWFDISAGRIHGYSQDRIGSYHNQQDFSAFVSSVDFNWNMNILEFKRSLDNCL